MSKYEEKFTVEKNGHRLSAWEHVAKKQILRFLNDDEFREYISNEVLKNDENPPGPFTRFLYWFGMSCEGAGWGVMINSSEKWQRIYLMDHYYKKMHEWRDQILEVYENEV
jgi:hypothetical protein